MSTIWRVMFLAERYGRLTLTVEEVSEQIGIAPVTIKNRRSRGEGFDWLKSDGWALYADVADVAAYLESHRTSSAATPA